MNNQTQVEAAYNEFMKKDIANPLNWRSVDAYKVHNNEHFSDLQNTWAVGTTKCTWKLVSPWGTLHRNFEPVSKHNIKTDHITNDPPVVERPFQKVFDKILTKPAYSKNEVSSKGWAPFHVQNKSMNNRSSVNHNIVTHQDNSFSGAITVGVLDKKVTNKKKGIG